MRVPFAGGWGCIGGRGGRSDDLRFSKCAPPTRPRVEGVQVGSSGPAGVSGCPPPPAPPAGAEGDRFQHNVPSRDRSAGPCPRARPSRAPRLGCRGGSSGARVRHGHGGAIRPGTLREARRPGVPQRSLRTCERWDRRSSDGVSMRLDCVRHCFGMIGHACCHPGSSALIARFRTGRGGGGCRRV